MTLAMRMRYKPYARGELAAWENYVQEPEKLKGSWRESFAGGAKPLHIELGCGKGAFLARHALMNRDINYLGVDIKSEMLVVAKRNIQGLFGDADMNAGNVKLCSHNIERIKDILSAHDNVQRVYINFCNPWYKSGHAKHRLTHPRQLVQYRGFMAKDAQIWLKTDDKPLFNDSLRYFGLCGFNIIYITHNLHENEPGWNIRTEHEEMFAAGGLPIYACIAQMEDARLDEEAIMKWRTI